jgi:Zn-dependent peptidase ImmA (M78 family)
VPIDNIPDEAVIGVMAHELAHAWLNEHQLPEHSEKREAEANELATEWGFGNELALLESS